MFTLSHFRCESTSHWCYLLEFNDRAIFSRVSHCCSAIKSAVVFTHTPRWQLLLANIYRPSEHRIFQPKKFLCKHELFSYYRLCCCMLRCQILHFEVFLIGFLDELCNSKQKGRIESSLLSIWYECHFFWHQTPAGKLPKCKPNAKIVGKI